MNPNNKFPSNNLYKLPNLDKLTEQHTPFVERKNNHFNQSNFIVDSAIFYLKERLSIDEVIKELTFSAVAAITYIFMQNTGRIAALKGFGNLIGIMLICAMVYNLYKASFKTLAPGVICLVGGLVLLQTNLFHQFFKFISTETVEYIIGTGAFFIALSLFKTGRSQ